MIEENVEQEITYHRSHRDGYTNREGGGGGGQGQRQTGTDRETETETDTERDRDRWFIVKVTDPYSIVESGGRGTLPHYVR